MADHRAALAKAVERAAHSQRLERLFVERGAAQAREKVAQTFVAAASLALGDDLVGDVASEVLYRVEAEADGALAAEHGKVAEGLVDVGRQDGDAHALGLG